jgi:tRNA-splicing ligase RtcB (3'-phosphate/5'-hydroxy nucleic acid ligase)
MPGTPGCRYSDGVEGKACEVIAVAQATRALKRLDEFRWEIPVDYRPGMRVPGLIYADEFILPQIEEDQALEQVANAATLPGIVRWAIAMPDIHWGYGFPIGGIAAMRLDDGVVSPGAVGYDINCGVRLLSTRLVEDEIRPHLGALADRLFHNIPSGVGAHGRLRLSISELLEVLREGAEWAVRQGYGRPSDLRRIESGGRIPGAKPEEVSQKALARGHDQLGTLGSGNHFLEIQQIEEIFDPSTAAVFGLHHPGQITVLIHCGSRGLGHQVCDDYLTVSGRALVRYGITLPDRQLACVPLASPEGEAYLGAMAAAANFAFANRQVITHWVRESFEEVLRRSADSIGLDIVYDVAHNMAKIEEHVVDGARMRLCVHRKGATRGFPAGHPEVAADYQNTGHPVFVPGDMGRYSYVLVGTSVGLAEAFGSTPHGAGRLRSRGAAKRLLKGVDIVDALARKGILVRVKSRELLAEEASEAYKDVADVVRVSNGAGLTRSVARLRPLAVVKG